MKVKNLNGLQNRVRNDDSFCNICFHIAFVQVGIEINLYVALKFLC